MMWTQTDEPKENKFPDKDVLMSGVLFEQKKPDRCNVRGEYFWSQAYTALSDLKRVEILFIAITPWSTLIY